MEFTNSKKYYVYIIYNKMAKRRGTRKAGIKRTKKVIMRKLKSTMKKTSALKRKLTQTLQQQQQQQQQQQLKQQLGKI
jgi:3-methyladenine DNA glycosylase AlkD